MSLGRPLVAACIVASALFVVPSVHAETTSTAILKMADGNFYHPASGKKAPVENDLRASLGLPLVPSTSDSNLTPQTSNPTPILSAVYRAQREMREKLVATGQDKIVNIEPVGQGTARKVTLAIWNRLTDEIVYVDALKNGTDLDLDGVAPTRVTVRLTNYINSDYATDDPNHLVVAVRYPIYHEVWKGKKVVSYDVEQAVYTPASGALLSPEVVAEGERMLDESINAAITSLGKETTISPELIKSIAIIEHSDRSALQRDAKASASKVYATIALNPENPYGYSRSSAGAFGLFQFIPSTYNRMAKRPGLGLNPDFKKGMSDPKNASKAAVAYMDAVLGDLPETAQAAPKDARSFEFFAAAYNGGSSKLKRAALVWDEQISGELKPKEILKRARLQGETIDYVKKLRVLMPVMMGRSLAVATQS